MALKKKLFEALEERAEAQSRLTRLAGRLAAAAVVREGREPAESPVRILAEMDSVHGRLGALNKIITAANNVCRLADGRTLSEAIVDRDSIARRIASLSTLAEAAYNSQFDHCNRDTPARVPLVNVDEMRRGAEALCSDRAALDVQIQQASWSFDVEL